MSNDLSTFVCQFSPAIQTEISAAVVEAYALEDVTNVPTCEAAVASNARLSKAIKGVAEERLDFTRKIDAVKKRAMEMEKHVTKSAVECVEALDAAIREHRAGLLAEIARREQAAAEAQRAQVEAETAAGEEHVTPPLVPVEPMLEVPKIPTRKAAKVLVTDITKIARLYFDLNESRLLADLKAGVVVRGAELVYEEVLVRR